MKRISDAQEKQYSALVEELRKRRSEVEDAFDSLEGSVEEYNATAEELTQLLIDVYGDIESYYNERSEKWQDSDAGEAYQTWMEAWSGSAENADVSRPIFYDDPDELADLPVEPDLS